MLTVIFNCDRCKLIRSKQIEKKLANDTISCPRCQNLVTLIYKEKGTELADIAGILEKIAASLASIEDKLDKSIVPQLLRIEGEALKASNKTTPQKLSQDNNPGLYQQIINFLLSKQVILNSCSSGHTPNPTLQSIATFMGNRYQSVKKLHETIKANFSTGDEFTLDLSGEPQEKIGALTQLCTQLHAIQFLEEYQYKKQTIKAKPSQNPKAINFLSGQWLELYLKKQMIISLRRVRPNAKYAYLVNGKITLPNGENREMDIIFKTEKELFWFEAKTKDYQGHIEKYHHLASLLNLDKEHVYLILASPPESMENLPTAYNLKVMTVEEFPKIFENYLKQNS